jgi:hypothetical protein
MLTIEQIENFGFQKGRVLSHDNFDQCWYYMLRDEVGKKFQVVIKFWKFSKYSTAERKVDDSFSAECQFDMRGPKTFNVDLNVNNMSPQEIVNWFDNMFQKMNCTYYQKYEDD